MRTRLTHPRKVLNAVESFLFAGLALHLFIERVHLANPSEPNFPGSNLFQNVTKNDVSAYFSKNSHLSPVTVSENENSPELENTSSTKSKNTASVDLGNTVSDESAVTASTEASTESKDTASSEKSESTISTETENTSSTEKSESTTSAESENMASTEKSESPTSVESENTASTEKSESATSAESFHQNISITTNGSSTAPNEDGKDAGELIKRNAELAPQPTISKETHDRIMAVFDVFIITTEAVSLLLTTMSACVYLRRDMRCTTAVYLVAMNVADTVCGFLVVLSSLWARFGGPSAKRTLAYNYLTVVGTQYLSLSARRSVYCLSVIVSLERFFVISFPLKARYFKIIRFPKLSVLALFAVVFSFHIYMPFKYQVTQSRTGGYRLGYTDWFRASRKEFDAVSNVGKFLFSYIPLFAGLALSVALMVALRKHAKATANLQEAKDDSKARQARQAERQLAMTIWLSTFLFTLLSLPNNTAHLVSTYHPTFGFRKVDHYLYRLVSRFSYLALIATRYTNFFSYLGLSTAFRRNLVRGILPRGLADKLLGSSGSRDRLRTSNYAVTGESMTVTKEGGGRCETTVSVVSGTL